MKDALMSESRYSGRVTIMLGEDQRALADRKARETHAVEPPNENAKRFKKHPLDARYEGNLSEIALAWFYEGEWTNLERKPGPDPGWDVVVGDWKLNVKATPWHNRAYPSLLVEDKLRRGAHAYALCVVDYQPLSTGDRAWDAVTVEYVGWARAEEVFNAPHKDLGYGPARCVPAKDLRLPTWRDRSEWE